MPRESETVKIQYDRAAIREILESDDPVASTKPPPLRVDISAMPAWKMKPVPMTTRRRNRDHAPPIS